MVVVGAGLAGVAAARRVREAGLDVVVLDRGHRVGGRMASPTTDGRIVDTGASYFTVSDPSFASVVADWQARGLAHPWTDTFHVASGGSLTAKSGPVRWSAPQGLCSLVEDLAVGLDVRRQAVESVHLGPRVDGMEVGAAVLAMPDPQARRLLDPAYEVELAVLTDPYEPVLALTAHWPERVWPDLDGVFVDGDPILTWIADDGRRREDGAPVLVAHSTAAFAAEHLATPNEAGPLMVVALLDVLGIASEPVSAQVHRWTFGRPAGQREHPFFLGEALGGLCGDAWSTRPRGEGAYRSGTALGATLAERLA